MHRATLPLLVLALACGSDPSPPPRPFTATTAVSGATSFAAGCDGVAPGAASRLYLGSAVEPQVAAHPGDRAHLVGVWQQDRWSNGGARGLVSAVSRDGGRTWALGAAPFTRCTGGTIANGGDYERASDPWVAIAPDGTVHQVALAFNRSGAYAQAILASRSTDGGLTWSDPLTLAVDTVPDFAVDKETVTADPLDARFAYATWDRLTDVNDPDQTQTTGPAWFTRTVDGGLTWQAPRVVYDPGKDAQTIGTQVLVLPDGTLLLAMTVLTGTASRGGPLASLAVLRSPDRGATWSAATPVAGVFSVGAVDPKTGGAIRSGTYLFSGAVDPGTGAVYLAWEDARFSNGAGPGIALARSDDGGQSFSDPVQVNAARRVAAFTPAAAVARSGEVAVLYYDLRDDDPDAPGRLGARTWLARSLDGGRTFREEAVGDLFDLRTAPFTAGLFLGDYQGLAAAEDAFLPFFARPAAERTAVVTVPW